MSSASVQSCTFIAVLSCLDNAGHHARALLRVAWMGLFGLRPSDGRGRRTAAVLPATRWMHFLSRTPRERTEVRVPIQHADGKQPPHRRHRKRNPHPRPLPRRCGRGEPSGLGVQCSSGPADHRPAEHPTFSGARVSARPLEGSVRHSVTCPSRSNVKIKARGISRRCHSNDAYVFLPRSSDNRLKKVVIDRELNLLRRFSSMNDHDCLAGSDSGRQDKYQRHERAQPQRQIYVCSVTSL
jgi:hypothetical protein